METTTISKKRQRSIDNDIEHHDEPVSKKKCISPLRTNDHADDAHHQRQSNPQDHSPLFTMPTCDVRIPMLSNMKSLRFHSPLQSAQRMKNYLRSESNNIPFLSLRDHIHFLWGKPSEKYKQLRLKKNQRLQHHHLPPTTTSSIATRNTSHLPILTSISSPENVSAEHRFLAENKVPSSVGVDRVVYLQQQQFPLKRLSIVTTMKMFAYKAQWESGVKGWDRKWDNANYFACSLLNGAAAKNRSVVVVVLDRTVTYYYDDDSLAQKDEIFALRPESTCTEVHSHFSPSSDQKQDRNVSSFSIHSSVVENVSCTAGAKRSHKNRECDCHNNKNKSVTATSDIMFHDDSTFVVTFRGAYIKNNRGFRIATEKFADVDGLFKIKQQINL